MKVEYDASADLDQLRAEVAILAIAGTRSPATLYDHEVGDISDAELASVVASIADSDMSVQPIRMMAGIDKHAVLRGVALAAHRSRATVHALPCSESAAAFALDHRYSHHSEPADEAVARLQREEWNTRRGDLVIVDDADHLSAEQLQALISRAGPMNTKLLLVVSPETPSGQNRHLVDALVDNLPWAVNGDHAVAAEATALGRVTEWLNSGHHLRTEIEQAAGALVARRDDLIEAYREVAAPKKWRSVSIEPIARDVGLGL